MSITPRSTELPTELVTRWDPSGRWVEVPEPFVADDGEMNPDLAPNGTAYVYSFDS